MRNRKKGDKEQNKMKRIGQNDKKRRFTTRERQEIKQYKKQKQEHKIANRHFTFFFFGLGIYRNARTLTQNVYAYTHANIHVGQEWT